MEKAAPHSEWRMRPSSLRSAEGASPSQRGRARPNPDPLRVRLRGRTEGRDADRPAGDIHRSRVQQRPMARFHRHRQEQSLLRDLPLPAGRRNPGRLAQAAQRGPRLPLDDGLRRPPPAPRHRRIVPGGLPAPGQDAEHRRAGPASARQRAAAAEAGGLCRLSRRQSLRHDGG